MTPVYFYNEQVQYYSKSQQVEIPELCNGYLAVNYGDVQVTVNDFPLLPRLAPGLVGGSTGLIGNAGEVYLGNNRQMKLIFGVPALGQTALLILVFKFYVPL